MPPRRILIVIVAALALAISLAAIVRFGGDQGARPSGGIELAGMEMSAAELREMTRETMGTSSLDDVPAAGPKDAAATLAGSRSGAVRTFELAARPVRWEYRSGQHVAAWGYQGQVPGPALRATEGETVRVTFRNELPVPTTVHWHGVDVPWQQDGVPGVTQEPIEPGDTFTYEFRAAPAGTRWYHTHGGAMGEEATQLDMGLAGPLVVAPRRPDTAAVDQTLVLDDWNIGPRGYNAAMMGGHGGHDGAYNVFTINGRAAPDVEEIVVRRGQRVRLRFINASTMSFHPMHLHGHQFRITALDGNPAPAPVTRNVALLAPGETADIEFVADNPGIWMLHCHELHHADAGMSMLLRYEGVTARFGDDPGAEHDQAH